MPFRKLRTLDEAERLVWLGPDHPRLWLTIAELWALSDRLCPRRYRPGVRKFRSVEALNAAREQADAGFVRARAVDNG